MRAAAFTLVELLVVIAVAAIIIGFAVTGFQNYSYYQQFDQGIADLKATLMHAQHNARVSASDTEHGVKILSSSLTEYQGTTYTLGAPGNVVTTFPAVTFTPTLTAGTDEIEFARLTGTPSATGTITITSVSLGETAAVVITAAGVIQ